MLSDENNSNIRFSLFQYWIEMGVYSKSHWYFLCEIVTCNPVRHCEIFYVHCTHVRRSMISQHYFQCIFFNIVLLLNTLKFNYINFNKLICSSVSIKILSIV